MEDEMNRIVRIGRSDGRGECTIGGPTRIIAPIMGRTPQALADGIAALDAHPVDLVEWRIDPLISRLDDPATAATAIEAAWEQAVSQAPVPVLATIRTGDEGGETDVEDGDYARLVTLLARFADAVDVEIARTGAHALIAQSHEAGAAVVASSHDFDQTPTDDALAALYADMAKAGADVLKVACRVATAEEAVRVLGAQIAAHRAHHRPIIGIGMGDAGALTRIGGSAVFSAATFATVGASSAPGQFTVEETRRVLDLVERAPRID